MAQTLRLSTRLFPASYCLKSTEGRQDQFKVISNKIRRTFNAKISIFPLDIIDAMEKQLVDNRDFFIEDDKKKRVGRPKNSESLFGLEGSFRQLVID
jgi:hypothetical protein